MLYDQIPILFYTTVILSPMAKYKSRFSLIIEQSKKEETTNLFKYILFVLPSLHSHSYFRQQASDSQTYSIPNIETFLAAYNTI